MSTSRPSENVVELHDLPSGIEAFLAELPSGLAKGTTERRVRSWLAARESGSRRDQEGHGTPESLVNAARGLEQVSRQLDVRHQRNRRWAYPAVVAVILLVVWVGLSHLIVDPFSELFDDFGLQLPTPTRWLFDAAAVTRRYPVLLCLSLLIIVAVLILLWRLLRRLLSRSVVWNLITVGNIRHLQRAATVCDRAARGFENGRTAAAVRGEVDLRWVPENFLYACSNQCTPEQSAALLRAMAEHYRDRERRRISSTGGFPAQLVVIGLGFGVFFIILAILAPLLRLLGALS